MRHCWSLVLVALLVSACCAAEGRAATGKTASHGAETVRFTGSITRGETFEKSLPRDLVFRLAPWEGGWLIAVTPADPPRVDFSTVVTPPYRGVNALQVQGWHFRNSDNTGPNEAGEKNVDAPQETREFAFVLDREALDRARHSLDSILWPSDTAAEARARRAHARIPKGSGTLVVTAMSLGNLEPGEKAWIESMEFSVEIVLPSARVEPVAGHAGRPQAAPTSEGPRQSR